MIDIRTHVDETGRVPFAKWLAGLDRAALKRVMVSLGRLEEGNIGALKSVGDGVHELRIAFGPGYRIISVGKATVW